MTEKPIHYRSLTESDWIGSWDLPPGVVVVVIESVDRYEPVRRLRKKDPRTGKMRDEQNTKVDIGFKGKKKHFLANKTCQKTIADMYGPNVLDWIGKPIAIYFDPTVEFGKKVVGGIRVRPTIPGRNVAPTEDALDRPVEPERAQQLEELRDREPGEEG